MSIPGSPLWAVVMPNENYRFLWDDLRAPASSINPAGQTAGADIDADDSTLLFSSSITETAAVILQMPHAWREGSDLRPHIHASKTPDAAGDIAWQIRYRLIATNEVPTDWTDWLDWDSRSGDPGSTQKNTIYGFPDIDMEGYTLSTIISVQIRRQHDATIDNYGADAKLWEFDIHYQSDSIGSIQEFIKDEVY